MIGTAASFWRLASCGLLGTLGGTAAAQTPLTDPITWMTDADRPADLPSGEVGAAVEFDISPQGRIENCDKRNARPSSLGETVCELLKQRARYEPAYDTEGRAVASSGVYGVGWSEQGVFKRPADYGGAVPRNNPGRWVGPADLPTSRLDRGEGGIVTVRFDITVEGRASNCSGESQEARINLAPIFCEVIERRARFRPPIGTDGRPFATIGRQDIRWMLP